MQTLNSGDTTWVLISSAMVLLMTPGLAFFYAGLVRDKDVINTIKMSFIALALIAVEWALVGYSTSFGKGGSLLGGLQWAGLAGVGMEPNADYAATIPHQVFMVFQMMFAIITPALISGAVVGRMKFRAYLLFILAWALIVYNPLAHMVWGVGGYLRELGAIDFAGGNVVHISAGVSALIAAIVLGPRENKGSHPVPHNIPFVVLGASLLWFGWFGFNAGSALTAGGLAGLAFVNTNLAAAAAVVTWVLLELTLKGKPTAVGASIAAVVGLVTITPGAGYVTPMASLAIGSIGAVTCYFAVQWTSRLRVDDTLDVFACHGVGGIVGSLLTGVFATKAVNSGGADGLLYGNPLLLVSQAKAVLVTATLAVSGTALILNVLKLTIGIRIEADSPEGIDAVEHGEMAYALPTPV